MKKPLNVKFWVGIGLALSFSFYIVLLIDQLNMDLECTPTDGMCNGGNTVIGDVHWAALMASFVLLPAWGIAIIAGVIIKWLVTRHKAKQQR